MTEVVVQEESGSYFTKQVRRYLDFKERIHLSRQRCERASQSAFDRVQPLDSISQIGSKVCEGRVHPPKSSSVAGRFRVSSCSRSSRASSVLSERVKITAVSRKLLWLQKFLYCKKVDHSHQKDFVWNIKKNCLN